MFIIILSLQNVLDYASWKNNIIYALQCAFKNVVIQTTIHCTCTHQKDNMCIRMCLTQYLPVVRKGIILCTLGEKNDVCNKICLILSYLKGH